jgi:hypothetical protein
LSSAPASQLFGITESDIAVLDDSDFNEVWAALGKVARARARAHADAATRQQDLSANHERSGGSKD